MKLRLACLLTILCFAASAWAAANPKKPAPHIVAIDPQVSNLMKAAPLIEPQPDGVIYLNVDAAALLRWTGSQVALGNDGGGNLKPDDGHLSTWSGENERPCWRMRVPEKGRYRTIINRSTAPGRESTIWLSFWQAGGERRVMKEVESSGGWDSFAPYEMGEVQLDAGETIVEFRPREWKSSFYLINLTDVRLIPIANDADSKAIQKIFTRLGLNQVPEFKALEKQTQELHALLADTDKRVRNDDFSRFTESSQFVAYDRLALRLKALQADAKTADIKMEALRSQLINNNKGEVAAGERKAIDAYFSALRLREDSATRNYPKVYFKPKPAAAGVASEARPGATTLFPTGNFQDLPIQECDMSRPVVNLALKPPPDAEARKARFTERNTGEQLAALARRLQSVLIPGTRGLEEFERLCTAGKGREALEAYREYFFKKLAHPEDFGAVTENLIYIGIRTTGKKSTLERPNPIALAKNLNNTVIGSNLRGETLIGEVGPPGCVWWAPNDLVLPPGAGWERGPDGSPFWKTPTGKDTARRIEFFRLLPRFGVGKMHTAHMGAFNALLESYVVDQNKEHLARWCEYVDDWALNSRRDREACPYGIRQATELEAQELRGILTLLRVALDERPEFARDFSAPTLARFLLQIVTEYAPYSIRMRRAEQANWGIMSICHLENVARFLNEFKAMSYFNREAWRLWMSNMIQHRTMDGENLEAWDEGHNYVDIVYAFPSVPCAALPPVATPADQTLFWDHLRMNMRSMLTHFSPDGDYWPSWLPYTGIRNSALMFRYLTPNREMGGKLPVCLIQNEPEARKRIETVANLGKPIEATLPSRTSDIAPYAAMFYLRESWMPGANYLMLHNFITRSQDQHIRYAPGETQGGSGRTMYELTSGASMVLGASPIFVDRKPDNRHFNGVRTGGKTTYCTQAGRNVVTTRFHTSRAFDLAEALQDAPYCNARHTDRGDFYGVYTLNLSKDNTPVTDVKALRQVMNVRGEGIYLVADRIENTGTASHEYSKFFTLPAKVREKGIADRVRVLAAEGNNLVEVDPAQRRMRTTNVGYENVTVHLFGQDFIFANALDANKEYKPLVKSQLQLIQEAVAKKQRYADIVASAGKRPVSAHWTGAGNQAMATLVYVRPAADTLAASVASDLKSCQPLPGPQGVTGCEAVTRTGARVWFQTGPARINRLQCGALAAEAETLLVVQKAGAQELSGMVLGCKTLSLNGKDLTLSRPDFEFAFASPSEPKLTLAEPIHRPIDTVRISPEQNVFTDSIEVSFEIPTQQTEDIEFRYTLDGSDPTLSSTRYNGPFELAATSFVKVRPFRKGLKETPWEMPGVDAGLTVGAVFRKEAPRPAQPAGESKPGLNYDYFEGDWPSLFTYAGIDGVLEPKAKGEVKGLLEPAETAALRKTSGAYAIRYLGRVRIPRSGVYSFYAPEHLYTTTMDAGYDLRVFIDGEEWFPTPELHSENIWHIPLETGEHTIKVAFADYRTKPFRDEFWMCWKEEEMWQGIPKLEISGPGIGKQPLPSTWLFH